MMLLIRAASMSRELEGLRPFLVGDLERHEEREEQPVLGHDVRREPSLELPVGDRRDMLHR